MISKQKIKRFLNGYQPGDAMHDIIPMKPGWYSRWVFPVFAAILGLVLWLLWIIPHPDVVIARGVLTDISIRNRSVHAEVSVAESDTRKIDSGKAVLLHCIDFPVREYGAISGVLRSVSSSDGADNLAVDIVLPKGFITDKNKSIDYKNGLKVDLLIIAKEMRLLQRIFNKSARAVSVQ